MKFCLFFSLFSDSNPNFPSEFVTVWRRIKFCISLRIKFCICSLFSSTLRTNFWKEKFSFSQSWIRLYEFNFPYFSVSFAVVTQILHLNLSEFEREFNSAFTPILSLRWGGIFNRKNFHFVKTEIRSTDEILLIFQFILPFKPKFYIWICNSLKEN